MDDLPDNRRLLADVLGSVGFEITEAGDGAEAVNRFGQRPVDLVLMDMRMPVMDGYEVCRRLKAMPGLAEVPVIFISALAETDIKVRAFASGGVDYVTKPFQEAEVLARVGTHLALQAMRRANAIQQAELERCTSDLLRGDQLIVEIGQRLARSLRDRQYLAHIGGDEFAVILTPLDNPDAFAAPVRRMLQAVAEPLSLEDHKLQLTASIGVAVFPQAADGMEAEQVLRQSDQAMYLAKLTGKNRYHLFDPLKDESTRERFIRIEEVRQGLTAGEMRLHYQPKVWLATGQVAGFEALIRWQHPQRGLVPPGQFIPLLERHPLAVTLGDWVIETALSQLAAWNARGICTCVGVNVDALQLADPDFVPRLARQLAAQPGVAPAQLDLEILETSALDNMAEEAALIARVQRMGVTCSLDDFGTGYSSLTFLKQLAAQTIKIDQSFVRGMLDDSEHASIVNSVLGLARSFDRQTLAEGVETEHQGRMLLELGCDLAQGYAIARPMPAAEMPAWLAQWQVPPSWLHITPLEPGDVPLLLAEVEHHAWMKAMRQYLAAAGRAGLQLRCLVSQARHATPLQHEGGARCGGGSPLRLASGRGRAARHRAGAEGALVRDPGQRGRPGGRSPRGAARLVKARGPQRGAGAGAQRPAPAPQRHVRRRESSLSTPLRGACLAPAPSRGVPVDRNKLYWRMTECAG
ncbi:MULTISPECIES: EAL domain-containing protein [unclassified Thiocapsa]|uniref:two-component system response regulator n=1 Tax=unclassified Thiocapsa TaxID=2641286 RepID=UPI0035B16AE8